VECDAEYGQRTAVNLLRSCPRIAGVDAPPGDSGPVGCVLLAIVAAAREWDQPCNGTCYCDNIREAHVGRRGRFCESGRNRGRARGGYWPTEELQGFTVMFSTDVSILGDVRRYPCIL
jgi:hypothetical protein